MSEKNYDLSSLFMAVHSTSWAMECAKFCNFFEFLNFVVEKISLRVLSVIELF